ncbi:MAG: polymer-forming cytoskeletal protein [Alphaproteobacteria bacterium]|nr:polymer-forming cytoskeletal protein [Alphaproteobacteria bacterium]
MVDSLISDDLTIEGDIEVKSGKLVVAGKVDGNITADSVEVREGGAVQGAVKAENVNIQGKHSGKIDCTELSLNARSDVRSDVTAKSMTSEKGAKLVGKVQITG